MNRVVLAVRGGGGVGGMIFDLTSRAVSHSTG